MSLEFPKGFLASVEPVTAQMRKACGVCGCAIREHRLKVKSVGRIKGKDVEQYEVYCSACGQTLLQRIAKNVVDVQEELGFPPVGTPMGPEDT